MPISLPGLKSPPTRRDSLREPQAVPAAALLANLVEELIDGFAHTRQPSRSATVRSLATYQPSAVTWYLAR